MLGDLSSFASKTPFDVQGIRATAKQLLAMSIESEKVIPTLKALGDVSAGLGVDLDRLAYNYGQVKTQTKLTGVELKDFMRAGVPLLGELASMLNKSEAEIQEMVSAGQIGFPLVEAAFQRMTGEGGKFNNLMAEQAKTLGGLLSNLGDEITQSSEAIGTALLPVAKEIVIKLIEITQAVTAWVKKNPELAGTILKVALAVTGLLTAVGLLGVIIPQLVAGWAAITTAFGIAKVAALALTAQFGLLNLVLMGSVIGALIATVYYVVKAVQEFQKFSDEVGGWRNALALSFLHVKQRFLEFVLAIVQGISNVLDAIPGIDNAFGTVIDGLKIMIGEVDAEFNNLAATLYVPGTAAEDAATKVDTAATSMNQDFSRMVKGADEMSEAVKERFGMLVDSVKSVREEIRKTYDDIKSATDDYLKSVGKENEDYEQSVVETVAGAQKKKLDLEVELRSAQAKGEYDRIKDLGVKIQEQEAIIISYNTLQLDLDKRIDEERARLSMNELQRLQFDHNKKLEVMQIEYLQDQANRLKKMVELQTEHNQILAMVDADKKAKLEAEVAKGKATRARLADERAGLKGWIDETTAMYESYVSGVNSILSRIKSSAGGGGFVNPNAGMFSGARATGGPVQPGRTFLVGERGPELFTPGQYGNIAANGGAGMTIIITGNEFVGEDGIADRISRDIMRNLKNNVKL